MKLNTGKSAVLCSFPTGLLAHDEIGLRPSTSQYLQRGSNGPPFELRVKFQFSEVMKQDPVDGYALLISF